MTMYYVNPPPAPDPRFAKVRRALEAHNQRVAAEFRAEVEANRRRQARARDASRPESLEERNQRIAAEVRAEVEFRRRAREVATTGQRLLGMIDKAERLESPDAREAAASRMVAELDRLEGNVNR